MVWGSNPGCTTEKSIALAWLHCHAHVRQEYFTHFDPSQSLRGAAGNGRFPRKKSCWLNSFIYSKYNTKEKKKSCWLNSFIYSKYNTYIMKCNKINDHACCYVLHLFCWLKCWNWQMLDRYMRHLSFWHSLKFDGTLQKALLWLYENLNVHAEKLTTPALLVIWLKKLG